MSDSSFQSEIPKARINLKLDLHTGGAGKKTELPLKLLVAGDFSNGQASAPLSERKKINLNKNNFDAVLSEYSPKVNLTVKNTLAGDGSEDNISLTFRSMKDFTPEQVSRQIPQLKAMLSMRSLLRDLKANLLDRQHHDSKIAVPQKTTGQTTRACLVYQQNAGRYRGVSPANDAASGADRRVAGGYRTEGRDAQYIRDGPAGGEWGF